MSSPGSEEGAYPGPMAARGLLDCSFCGKTPKQVLKLVAGPGVYICDECVSLCVEIFEDEAAAELEDEAVDGGRLRTDFDTLRERLREARRTR